MAASTRRRLLGYGTALLAAAPAGNAVLLAHDPQHDPNLDAALIRACERVHASHAEVKQLNADTAETAETMDAACEAMFEAMEEVANIRPVTRVGLQAKARAMIAGFEFDMPVDIGATVEEVATAHETLAWRLAHDLLAMPT